MKSGLILLTIAFLASSATAVWYRSRSEEYRRQLELPEKERKIQNGEKARMALNSLPPAPPPTTNAPAVVSVPPPDNSNELQEEIVQLRSSLQQKDSVIASLQQQATNRPGERPREWRDWSSRLEEMKTSDPKRYEEIMKARQESQQRVQKSFAEKAAHLINQDISELSEAEQTDYQVMMGLLDQTWKLAEQLRTDMPRPERREIMHSMRENMVTLEPLLMAERSREFYSLAKQLGYSDNDAAGFVNYLNETIEVTSLQPIYRGMRPGGPPDGRWGQDGGMTNRP